jgi:thymidylate synthase
MPLITRRSSTRRASRLVPRQLRLNRRPLPVRHPELTRHDPHSATPELESQPAASCLELIGFGAFGDPELAAIAAKLRHLPLALYGVAPARRRLAIPAHDRGKGPRHRQPALPHLLAEHSGISLAGMQFQADTLDDALGAIMRRLLKSGNRILAGKGRAREFTGVLVKLTDPRARFSRTEDRSTLFSCLGETLWYLSGSDRLDHIEYYIKGYRKFISASRHAKVAPGAYGPRLYGGGEASQMAELVATLKEKQGRSDTRQAVAQIFSRADLKSSKGDVPCTTTLQFLPRRGKLHLIATMRSNDVYRGFPHDVFAFTFIQELVARKLSMEVGTYSHFVGSLHLYDENAARARDFLNEGYQTPMSMPPMPTGDPDVPLAWLLQMEEAIRLGGAEPDTAIIEDYWQDLARILRIKALLKDRRLREVALLKKQMSTPVYNAFIRRRELAAVEKAGPQHDLLGIVPGVANAAEMELN